MAVVTFGSPEATRIIQRNRLLGNCEMIECPTCHGLKTMIAYESCECCGRKSEKEVLCQSCKGRGHVLRDQEGFDHSMTEEEARWWLK